MNILKGYKKDDEECKPLLFKFLTHSKWPPFCLPLDSGWESVPAAGEERRPSGDADL